MKNNKEIRFIPSNLRVITIEKTSKCSCGTPDGVCVCNDAGNVVEESRTIAGTAIVFNSQSELLSEDGLRFHETILPEAVTPELINKSDIVFLYQHDKKSGVLARSKYGTGTLNIAINELGVDFNFDAPCSPNGDNILESVKRGDLDSCSFAMMVKQGNDSWLKVGDIYQRTIKKIDDIADMSIVVNPAYKSTSVSARGLKEFVENEVKEAEAQRVKDEQILEARKLELKEYYDNLFK